VIATILVIMGAMALTTHFIVHTVLGAFVAGVLIGESPILSKHIDEQLRGLMLAFFMPVFFGIAGLSTDLTVLRDPQLALMALGLIVIASVGKFAGAFIGGEIGGLTRRESLALACGMNARGSTEVIVATIGLSMGALSENLFTMIVAMAVVTTMAMPPMLRWALARRTDAQSGRGTAGTRGVRGERVCPEPRAHVARGGPEPEREVCRAARRTDRRPARPAHDGLGAVRNRQEQGQGPWQAGKGRRRGPRSRRGRREGGGRGKQAAPDQRR
jgi:hypothetical protein